MEEKGFSKLYESYRSYIINIVNQRINNFDDAEDLFHEIFLSYYINKKQIYDVKKWINGTLRIKILNFIKTISHNTLDIDSISNMIFYRDDDYREISYIIKDAFDSEETLNDETERDLLKLVVNENYSITKAAKKLGLTKRQAHYRYNKILNRLYSYFNKIGISSFEDLF